MFETSGKSANPLIEADSVRGTAENIAAVVSYLQVAEVAIGDQGNEMCDEAVAGRNLVLWCLHQAAQFIVNK